MVSEEYLKMLDRVYSKLPKKTLEYKRFELPEPLCTVAGSKTVLHNFKEICDRLNRDPKHVMKFLTRELATLGVAEGSRAVFQGRFSEDTFKRLIQRYVKDFVVCPVCKRPDTRIVKEKKFTFLICEACGAKSSIPHLK